MKGQDLSGVSSLACPAGYEPCHPPSRFPRECGTGDASARVLTVNGCSSPCSQKILLPADAEDAVRALVDECCPELRAHVAAWLACYKDNGLRDSYCRQKQRSRG